jgi:hypothetical protein
MEDVPHEVVMSNGVPIVAFSREETTLAALPFFSLAYGHRRRAYRYVYETKLTSPSVDATLSWQVSADPLYGFPDAFDRKVFKVIEHIALESGRPVENPVRFSLRRVLDLLGLAPFPSHFAQVRSTLRRIAAVTVQSHLSYTTGQYAGKATHVFHLYDAVSFKDAARRDEILLDDQWIAFGAWYLQTLNHDPLPSLDLTYFRQLRHPIASRLYELLTAKFSGVFQHRLSGWRVAYPILCQLLPAQAAQASPQRHLEAAHQQLISSGFLAKVAWERIERTWMILYVPGARARAMYAPVFGRSVLMSGPAPAGQDGLVTGSAFPARPYSRYRR